MFTDKSFIVAILISAVAHSLIFYQLPSLKGLFKQADKLKDLEVNYLQMSELNKLKSLELTKENPLPAESIPRIESLSAGLDLPHQEKLKPSNFREAISTGFKDFGKRPLLAKEIGLKKKISLPLIASDALSHPGYKNYYQEIRSKIKDCAYKNYDAAQIGEVYLTFVISSNGKLNDLRLISEKSVSDSYLREIALKSIQDASPYPAFPKELKYPQLTFNVIISFEMSD